MTTQNNNHKAIREAQPEHEKRIRDAVASSFSDNDLRALLADLDEARAALSAAKAGGWQDISTAPKDGAVFWVYNGEQGRMRWTSGDVPGGSWALWIWDDQLLADLLREIVAYCREAGHDWSSLTEAEHMLAALSSQPSPEQAGVSDGWAIDDNGDGSINVKTPDGYACRLFKSGGGGVESVAYRLAILALRPQPARHPDTERCIKARNDLNAALHGDSALIDDLEHAVANACARLSRPAQQAVPMTGKQARLLSREELADCCGGCASNSAIETWMRRAIERFCEVNGITAQGAQGEQA